MCSARGHPVLPGWGCPIRTPSDHCLPAAPRGISLPGHVLHRLQMPRHPPCALRANPPAVTGPKEPAHHNEPSSFTTCMSLQHQHTHTSTRSPSQCSPLAFDVIRAASLRSPRPKSGFPPNSEPIRPPVACTFAWLIPVSSTQNPPDSTDACASLLLPYASPRLSLVKVAAKEDTGSSLPALATLCQPLPTEV
jgi:hypothetical protein